MAVQRRNTRQRQLVLDAVRSRCDHPTADAIYLEVREKDPRVSRGTVYRNLNLLAHEGAIQAIKAPGGSRFDKRCDHHAHIMCTECGAVSDLALPYDEDLNAAAERESGFSSVSHHALFEGVCRSCARKDAGR